MNRKPPSVQNSAGQHAFAASMGTFFALALVKFGNPVIFEARVEPPADFWEWLYQPWPVRWAYYLLAVLCLAAVPLGRWRKETPKWVLALPVIWLLWQVVSATQTVDAVLTGYTLPHFAACVACFFLGWFTLANIKDLRLFWLLLALGFCWIIRSGFEQHFGGLEQTRQYFFLYILPNLPEPPTDYIRKISSNRIFSTLFYPNSFAGAILLLLPICSVTVWNLTAKYGRKFQSFVIFAVVAAALACLYWTGSKSGWLLMLIATVLALLHLNFTRRAKSIAVAMLLGMGLVGFAVKYAGFFERGATSVVARTDYWRAAINTFQERPLLGSGPGTFGVEYAKVRAPESEMARLAHNDYLEQASDSGFIGFLAYIGFIFGSLILLYRYRIRRSGILHRATWLGVFAISLQGLAEFNLYIPALAWPTFLFVGWLWGSAPDSPEIALHPQNNSPG